MLDPKTEATKLLEHFWAWRTFPVSPVVIARRLGLEVFETELPGNVSGALLKEAGHDPMITIDRDDHPSRKRFSCARELGNYISRVNSGESTSEYGYVDFRGKSDHEDVFANQFAAHLLMPNEMVEDLQKRGWSHYKMADFFGVSLEYLKHRMTN
jgi:Zn-dependent peptidase ImmA (M78 family)